MYYSPNEGHAPPLQVVRAVRPVIPARVGSNAGVCVYIYIYIHTRTHTSICVCIYIYIYIQGEREIERERCVYIYIYICMSICIYIYVLMPYYARSYHTISFGYIIRQADETAVCAASAAAGSS